MGTSRRKSDPALAQSFPLTVVLPVFNGADYLSRTLPALLENDLAHVEVIVVDDGSTDGTLDVLRAWEEAAAIRVLRTPRQSGPAAARNLGAQDASHPFILFLDADVELPGQAIEWIRDSLDLYRHRPEVVGVLGCYSEAVPHLNPPSRFRNLVTIYLYRQTETVSPFLHTSIFAVQKDVLLKAGGFDESLRQAEDFRLGLCLGSRGKRFVIDWRIRGVHLKRYTWTGILREDWQRVTTLAGIRLSPEERRFSLRAHRWNRLAALITPGLVVLGLGAIPWWGATGTALAGPGIILHLLLHGGFLRFVFRKEGAVLTLKAAGFLFLEMLWANLALAWGLLRRQLKPQPSTAHTQ